MPNVHCGYPDCVYGEENSKQQKEIEYHQVMGAEVAPNLYGGKNCNQEIPMWTCVAEGDKDEERGFLKNITLSARTFPAGTKVIIEEPICPNCRSLRYMKFPVPKRGSLFIDVCECGFDWKLWVKNRYS